MYESLAAKTVVSLARHWRWLALGALVPFLLAVLLSLTEGRAYVATIDAVPRRARTEVNYDARIRTVSSESPAQTQGAQGGLSVMPLTAVSAERRQALADLVRNPDIEKAVREQLGDALPAHLKEPGALLSLIQARVLQRSELIRITVEAPTPALAEGIASAWGQAYERHANRLYAGALDAPIAAQAELVLARQKYEAAQNSLTAFVAVSTIGENTRLLERKQELAKGMSAPHLSLASDLARLALRVEVLLSEAEAMQQQLAAARDGGTASTNALSLTLLKAQAFAASGSLPANLQLQVTPSGPAATLDQQRADVAAFILALREWRERLDRNILELSRLRAGPSSSSGASPLASESVTRDIESEIRELEATISRETAQKRDLEQTRDIAWETFSSLLKTVEEARVSGALGSGNEVSITSQSVVSIPKSNQSLLRISLAASMGLLLAALVILSYELVKTARGERTYVESGPHQLDPTRPLPDAVPTG